MIRKRKLAIVIAGALLLAGVAFGVSVNNRDGLQSRSIASANNRGVAASEVYAWYSNEQWTCDGTTVSRPVSCVSVKTGKTVSDSRCTDTKPESSFLLNRGDEGNPPATCKDMLSILHRQYPYQNFKDFYCSENPQACRLLEKSNDKRPLYAFNSTSSNQENANIGTVTTKKGWHVFSYEGSIIGTRAPGMVLNELHYEIRNYDPNILKIGNIKLYDGITTVDSLNQFSCTQEYKKNTKKLLITCSLVQPKKTVFNIKESRGYVPLYLLFDVLKAETSNQVMQLKFTGGVYNGRQNNWHDQTYPVKFKTLNETDYCGQYPDRCETTADISVLSPNGGEVLELGKNLYPTKPFIKYDVKNAPENSWVALGLFKSGVFLGYIAIGTDSSYKDGIDWEVGVYRDYIGGPVHKASAGNDYTIEAMLYTGEKPVGKVPQIPAQTAITFDRSDSVFSLVSSPVATCTDSDGGVNYNVKGVCSDGSGKAPWSDSCTTSSSDNVVKLEEVYCGNENYCYGNMTICPNGCSDGACIVVSD